MEVSNAPSGGVVMPHDLHRSGTKVMVCMWLSFYLPKDYGDIFITAVYTPCTGNVCKQLHCEGYHRVHQNRLLGCTQTPKTTSHVRSNIASGGKKTKPSGAKT